MDVISSFVQKCLFTVCLISATLIAQNKIDQGVVEYGFRNNGKVEENVSLLMFYNEGLVSYKMVGRVSKEKEKQFLE